ncbi:MAG TPA: RHS repeat domain-containing protein, partial [Gemmatimonadales bacterium]|nr:RHS repeat domain-containing protein [Gemmatimonadales bacterium]
MSARLRLLSIFAVSCFPLALPTSARAQGQGGSSNWAVTVGTSVPVLTHDTASGPHTIGFVVTNTGTKSNAVSLACGATGEVTCDGLSLSSVTLAPDEDVTVEVTYSVGYTNGTVELTATGEHKSGGVAQYIVKVPPSAVSRAKAGGGGGGSYSVAVAPDYAPVTKPSNTTQNASFTIYNSGQYADTYTLTCIGIGVGCVSVNPTSLSLDPLDDGAATVTYTVGTSSGTLKLRAAGIASDYGSYLVTPSNVPPTVSLAPHNAGYRDVAKCVAGCFDGTWAHSTPAYVSLGTPRSVTLQYSSANAKPLSVIFLDVSMPSGWAPTTYSFQVRTTATGALLTLGNGTQTVFYTASGTQLNRVALAVSPLTNGLTTGWYDVEVLATANYASGGPATTTVTTRLLVVDENGSIFGRGVTMPGLQQLHFKTGSYSVAVTEGDGSIAYYHRPNGTAPFETPGGTSLSLIDDGNGFYRRVALDGSYVTFNASGRMINAVDRFGNTTSYTQVSEYLYYITDPMGKKFTFTYQNGKLYQVKGPGLLRTTTYTYDGSNRLTKITDPDGLFTQFGYDGSNRLTTITNRAGKVTTLTYDGVHRVSTVTAPSISLYTGGNAQPVVTLTAAERVVWQPSIPGTSASSPKGAIAASTVQATVKDPLNYTTKYKLDKHGAPTAITDALSQTTTITRDSMARPTVVLSPSGFRMQYYYGSGTQAYLLTAMSNITTGRTINYAYNSN